MFCTTPISLTYSPLITLHKEPIDGGFGVIFDISIVTVFCLPDVSTMIRSTLLSFTFLTLPLKKLCLQIQTHWGVRALVNEF